MSITKSVANEMVGAGGKWMDAHRRPPTRPWFLTVNPDVLDIFYPDLCVLGQGFQADCGARTVYRHGYDYAVARFGLSMKLLAEHGFWVPMPRSGDCEERVYDTMLLNTAWRDYIKARRLTHWHTFVLARMGRVEPDRALLGYKKLALDLALA